MVTSVEKLTEHHEGMFTSSVAFIHLLRACVTHLVTLTS